MPKQARKIDMPLLGSLSKGVEKSRGTDVREAMDVVVSALVD